MAVKQNKKEPVSAPATKTSDTLQVLVLLAFIVLITYVCFSSITKNGFTNWDDNGYVFENPNLARPLPEAIRYFFGPHYFIGNYIPITMIVYSIEYHVGKLDPEFFHRIQLYLHLANVLLVFWFSWLLSKKKILVAAFVALFFAIHPMHVESVAWIAELKDVLYTFFFMAGLICYHNYQQKLKTASATSKQIVKSLSFTFVLFILSVLSKPAAIVFPLLLLLLDFYDRRVFNRRILLEKIPFFIVSFIFGYVAIVAQKADNLLHAYHSLGQRLLFASHSFLSYLWKFFVPARLSNFYPYPDVEQGIPVAYYLAPAVVLLLIYVLYLSVRYSRLYLFEALFFFINLVLVLQFVSVGDAIMADRYTYVPYIGLLFILGMVFDRFYQNGKQRFALLATVLILVGAACYATQQRTLVWKNDDTLATNLLENYPDDRLALNNKGFILSEQGRMQEAIPLYEKALRLKAGYARASINLINAHLSLNNIPAALKVVNAALVYDATDLHLLNSKGSILTRQENYKEAAAVYTQLLNLQKDNLGACINLSQCYVLLKDYAKAIIIIDNGLRFYPSNYILLNNKGYALMSLNKYQEAIPYFKSSLTQRPDFSTAQINLEECYRVINAATTATK